MAVCSPTLCVGLQAVLGIASVCVAALMPRCNAGTCRIAPPKHALFLLLFSLFIAPPLLLLQERAAW